MCRESQLVIHDVICKPQLSSKERNKCFAFFSFSQRMQVKATQRFASTGNLSFLSSSPACSPIKTFFTWDITNLIDLPKVIWHFYWLAKSNLIFTSKQIWGSNERPSSIPSRYSVLPMQLSPTWDQAPKMVPKKSQFCSQGPIFTLKYL